MPRISVIIPLYEKAATVVRTLDSVRDQGFGDFEVIVVDDGSKDEGPSLVREYSDPRVRLIVQENAGPGAARNRGAREAEGEYLAFLDADDEWFPNYLEEAMRPLEEDPAVAASVVGYFDCLTNRSSEPFWREQGLRTGTVQVGPDTRTRLILDLLRFMAPWSTTLRRDLFMELEGFYDSEKALYGEDTHLWLKLLFAGEPVHVDLRPLVRFHREDSNLSGNLQGARPLEPFLQDPDDLTGRCPPHLRTLLDDVLREKAYKTACMLGFWGQWRQAKRVRSRFSSLRGWRSPLYFPALAAGTPVASVIGPLWRLIAGRPGGKAS